MGTFTPNIGIYIPAAGETNFSDSFASGMMNLDSHDHSGGPNKGVAISTTGLANGSVTYEKLASNVADTTTGIGTNGSLQNQLQLLGVLKNLYTVANTGGTGFLSINGSTVAGRTFQNTSSLTWTNADGIAGNPSAVVNLSGISPLPVVNGGTGVTTLNAWDVVCGGTVTNGPVQQVSGEGTAAYVLTSQGSGSLPVWASNYVLPAKPCFQGIVNSALLAVTGDGTFYRVNFQAATFDQASNFVTGNVGTSGFTAPYTGIYLFNYYFNVRLNSTSINQLVVQPWVNGVSVANLIYINPTNLPVSPTNALAVSATQMLKLNANDLVYPVLEAAGTTKQLDILQGSFFQGYIVC